MTYFTEDAPLMCPVARTFGEPTAQANCRGGFCAVWRWEKITTAHPNWKDAVRAVAETTGEKQPYAKASAEVAANKEKYGLISDRGYCGLGAQP